MIDSTPPCNRVSMKGSDSWRYVKEDLIIPHNVSFYELIKATLAYLSTSGGEVVNPPLCGLNRLTSNFPSTISKATKNTVTQIVACFGTKTRTEMKYYLLRP